MKRLTMRKIGEAPRLRASGLSTGRIAASLGVGQSTASEHLQRIERFALIWPLAAEMTDAVLEALPFHPIGGVSRLAGAPPDRPAIHREIRRPGVTLSLLWEEYRAVHPDGYGYSRPGRSASPLERAAGAGDAPAPHRRGAGICRLRGHHAGGDRRRHGRG